MTAQEPHAPLTERQSRILERVADIGFVTIEGLAEEFGVSAQTVRRDIIRLSQTGRLQRFHGGAGPVVEAARLDHRAKRSIATTEKQAVGRIAAAAIPDRATLFLDVGTTIEACARELARRPGFQVFTNSMRAAMAFDPAEHAVHVLGGRMAGRDGSLVGEDVVLALQGIRLDVALIACSAVDPAGRVMDFDLSKIAVKRAAMHAAARSVLAATASKFGRTALATIAPLEHFVTIATPPPTA